MACACGSGGGGSVAYMVQYTGTDGVQVTEYVADLGAYRMLRDAVQGAGGSVRSAVQVPRKRMVEWEAARAG